MFIEITKRMSLLRSLENYCATCSINITRPRRSRIWEFASSIKIAPEPNFGESQAPDAIAQTIPKRLPTALNASMARSRSSRMCAAEI